MCERENESSCTPSNLDDAAIRISKSVWHGRSVSSGGRTFSLDAVIALATVMIVVFDVGVDGEVL